MYRYLDESVFYDSLNPYYLVMRSQFYKEDSLYDKSIQDINHALKLSPNDTDYINLRGTFKFYKQDFSGALSDLKILSVSSKKSPDIYEFRAFCLGRLEKFKEAYQDANIALNLDSNRSKALVIRAISKYKLFNDREGAVNDMRKASNLGDTEAIEYMRAYEEYLKTHKKS
jgi:tetratricopeptide (TPR) repeat protein